MKRLFLISCVMIMGFNLSAQEMNRSIFDEKSQTDILIGYCNRDGLKSGDFGLAYNEEHTAYKAEDQALNSLKGRLDNYEFTVILGTWCGDSKEQVPRFIKLLDCLKYDLDRVKFIAVDRSKTAQDVPVSQFAIEKVPTFIVMKGGVEIGRITETPEVSLEGDLVKILSKE